jgi:hypothetical protein
MLAYSTEFPINNDANTEKVYAVFKKWLVNSPHYPFKSFTFGQLPPNEITTYAHMGHAVMLGQVDSANGTSSMGISHSASMNCDEKRNDSCRMFHKFFCRNA